MSHSLYDAFECSVRAQHGLLPPTRPEKRLAARDHREHPAPRRQPRPLFVGFGLVILRQSELEEFRTGT